MRATLAAVLSFVVGVYFSHVLTLPAREFLLEERNEAQFIAMRLNTELIRARVAVREAEKAVKRAERACRTPVAAGEELPFVTSAYGLGCDAPGPYTKAGTTPLEGVTVAADPRVLPLGSRVKVEGWGELHVHDIGPDVRGRQLDIYMNDCNRAREWGERVKRVRVTHRPRGK